MRPWRQSNSVCPDTMSKSPASLATTGIPQDLTLVLAIQAVMEQQAESAEWEGVGEDEASEVEGQAVEGSVAIHHFHAVRDDALHGHGGGRRCGHWIRGKPCVSNGMGGKPSRFLARTSQLVGASLRSQ
jgi:hypothetical protein